MPQLNPIPWVFFMGLAWSTFLLFGLYKISKTYSPIMDSDNQLTQTQEMQTNEYFMPW
uniref:ATP synthase complex subunit 8 n=1 Tax=Asymmetron inferum TaxID=426587 RepID=A7X7C2_9BRAN|nr:ATP synthase F0 subunit 8 [Asymmetron inferum]BAF76601.1 ATP synthase subunit 8 [Asymmetron inferum]